MEPIKIAIVDDHKLVSKAIENMFSVRKDFRVVMNCSNGEEFLKELAKAEALPEVVLMDINMPVKNGIETTTDVTAKFPDVNVIALTMEDGEESVIGMLRAGAKGYLLKDSSPELLFEAIQLVKNGHTFYTDIVTQKLLSFKEEENALQKINESLKPKELEFMKLACSELTYKEIADKMNVSPRTVDGYRDSLLVKLNVRTRVGIVLFALKHNMC